MPFEYGGQTWPDTPWVMRTRQVRLLHPTPDEVDAYACRYPNGQILTAYRESPVTGIPQEPLTLVMEKDENGIHTGNLRMHLIPGQNPEGMIRCKAGRYDYPDGITPELFQDMTAYRIWKAQHPGQEPVRTMLWSDWSNPRPLGPVEADPVPEPGLVLMLAIGLLGLWVAGWRRKTR